MPLRRAHTTPPIVISLGGSLVVPNHINSAFLKKFHALLVSRIRNGQRFILVIGGGKTARTYQQAARKISKVANEDLDWLGIHATRLNAHLLRTIFRHFANPRLVTAVADMKRPNSHPLLIGAGFAPGSSTDFRAVQLAHAYGAKTILNLSNIDGVYTKDPRRYAKAKRISAMTWTAFRGMFGSAWDPGAHIPFDPVASKWASVWGIRVIVTHGTAIGNLKRILDGKPGRGTIIGPS